MRTADEMRERWLWELPLILRRPGMYATDGQNVDVFLGMRMRDMCFLDDRDAEYETVHESSRRYGPRGLVTPFDRTFGDLSSYTGEVASIRAEEFHRLGYLPVTRFLDTDTWALANDLCARLPEQDLRVSAIVAALGEPSFTGDRVLCYAPADGTGWMFFDSFTEPGVYPVEPDPRIRNARVPHTSPVDGFILTPHGRTVRTPEK